MMRNSHSDDSNSIPNRSVSNKNRHGSNSNNSNHHNMNVNPNVSNSYGSRGNGSGRGGETGEEGGSRNKTQGAGMSMNDQMRHRYGHHMPGGESNNAAMGAGAQSPGAGAGVGVMGDYQQGFAGHHHHNQFPFSHPSLGAAAALNSFGHAGMNPMNPAFYPHLGASAGATAAGLQHQASQQQALGDHLIDYRNSGNAGPHGGAVAGGAGSQAEQEEELLLNLLIARRRRAAMRSDAQQAGSQETWAEEFMTLRGRSGNSALLSQQNMAGMTGGGEGLPYDTFSAADSSHRSHTSARMSGMGQMSNVANNFGMGGANQHQQQFFSESSRLRQRGSGMGMAGMGSPQGATWMGGNAAAAAMHSPGRADSSYSQRPDMNTQLGLDVLERASMPSNMMHDARTAEQGQHQFHPFVMGRHHGQAFMHDSPMTSKQRPLDSKTGKEGSDAMQPGKKKRAHKKKPADMPRRPLSAYNLFFSEERERILREIEGGDEDESRGDDPESDKKEGKGGEPGKPKALLRPLLPSEKKRRPHRKTHGKISFQLLAQQVGQRWKALPDDRRKYYQDLAQEDMKRQKKAMEEYYQKRAETVAKESKG